MKTLLALLAVVVLAGCSKPAPAPVPEIAPRPIVQAAAAPPAPVAAPATPTDAQLNALIDAHTNAVPAVHRAHRSNDQTAEAAAYAKAYANAALANKLLGEHRYYEGPGHK